MNIKTISEFSIRYVGAYKKVAELGILHDLIQPTCKTNVYWENKGMLDELFSN
jgi:hypothetical protein